MKGEVALAADEAFHQPLPRAAGLRLPASPSPQLFVVVDTEEEFDWTAPFSRTATAVTALQHVHRAQRVFDRYAIRPTYVVDYPVAAQPDGFAPLQEIWRAGRCTIGAHLHPWVNPPYDEPLSARNSFTGNLPPELQRAKVRNLVDVIASRFETPRVFKAGRYGLSRVTVGVLEEFGFLVDSSVIPRMDFSAEGGPSFGNLDPLPFFLTDSLLEIPCTVDYTGWAGPMRPVLHRLASTRFLAAVRALGALRRVGMVNKVMLSPEGNTFTEMRALTRSLLNRGCRTFTLSFHSPSIEAGHTPYVRTAAQRAAFLDAIDRYCDFFMGELKGMPSTPLMFRTWVVSDLESAS